MSGEHSRTPASSATRRNQCPASVGMEAAVPDDPDTAAARDGEAAHWACQELLLGHVIAEGQIAPNGVVLTTEMCEAADIYHHDIVTTLAQYGVTPLQGQIEQRVAIPGLHAAHFGTPDFRILLAMPNGRHLLLLWDFKFGYRVVEAIDNAQLAEYILGICEGLDDLTTPVDVVARIVQPRSFHRSGVIREWRTTLIEQRAYANIATAKIIEALGPNPSAKVGPECRDCRGRGACAALQRAGFGAMDVAETTSALDLTAAAMALELRLVEQALDRLKARQTGLGAMVEASLRRGENVPGWRLEPGQSRERWTQPAENVIALGKAMHLDLGKPAAVITPRQARDKGLDPAIVAAMSERGPAGMVLAQVTAADLRRTFG